MSNHSPHSRNRSRVAALPSDRPYRRTHPLLPPLIGAALALLITLVARADEDFSRWPVLMNPFESTSGGGVMIDKYAPVVANGLCRTDFSVTIPGPQGGTFLNEAEFDARAVQGGILCENGRWRAKDGSAQGTTPFRVFLKDGVVRRPPA
jgi:hypothetical protein